MNSESVGEMNSCRRSAAEIQTLFSSLAMGGPGLGQSCSGKQKLERSWKQQVLSSAGWSLPAQLLISQLGSCRLRVRVHNSLRPGHHSGEVRETWGDRREGWRSSPESSSVPQNIPLYREKNSFVDDFREDGL